MNALPWHCRFLEILKKVNYFFSEGICIAATPIFTFGTIEYQKNNYYF
jgi:hypothetical protein